ISMRVVPAAVGVEATGPLWGPVDLSSRQAPWVTALIPGESAGLVLYSPRPPRASRPTKSSYVLVRQVPASEVLLSPILVRPVREQLEHDRVIRLLQAKYKRKFDVAINPGNEQITPVSVGSSPWYPDLVLQSTERGR